MADLAGLSGTALVTSAYVFVVMNLMPWGPTAPMVQATEQHKHWGMRAFQNTMEHAPLFLAALWTHAIFVSAEAATAMGWVYVALRACYPVVWAVVGGANGQPMAGYTWFLFGDKFNLMYCTFPQYGIVMYMAVANMLSLGCGFDLNALVVMPAAFAPIGMGLFLFHFCMGIIPIVQKAVIKPLFEPKAGMV